VSDKPNEQGESPNIHHTTTTEIIRFANSMSEDHVVLYLLEHGSPIKQSIMVCKFVGHIASMCRHESDSKVIQKWLAFGNQQDRQLITSALFTCLSVTSQQYFSLRTNQPPATSQQYSSLRTNQHQPSAQGFFYRPPDFYRSGAVRVATAVTAVYR
jgi:hypothetical protein